VQSCESPSSIAELDRTPRDPKLRKLANAIHIEAGIPEFEMGIRPIADFPPPP
jgi:hypothetical protein